MVMFSLLKLLHGYLHNDEYHINLLFQNKYDVIPTVNVDGLNHIEETYLKYDMLVAKRTNMHIQTNKCNATLGGVDLNRNYEF